MYKDTDLLGKRVISSDGSFLGDILEVSLIDDLPHVIIGKQVLFASKERMKKSETSFRIPYYEIKSVDDAVILNKSKDEILEDNRYYI